MKVTSIIIALFSVVVQAKHFKAARPTDDLSKILDLDNVETQEKLLNVAKVVAENPKDIGAAYNVLRENFPENDVSFADYKDNFVKVKKELKTSGIDVDFE